MLVSFVCQTKHVLRRIIPLIHRTLKYKKKNLAELR